MEKNMENKKIISPSDKAFDYMGRIDFEDANNPLFVFAGSMVSTKFTGTSVGMMIQPYMFYEVTWIGAIVDGIQYKFEMRYSELPLYFPIVS